jgi:hypothetical protein
VRVLIALLLSTTIAFAHAPDKFLRDAKGELIMNELGGHVPVLNPTVAEFHRTFKCPEFLRDFGDDVELSELYLVRNFAIWYDYHHPHGDASKAWHKVLVRHHCARTLQFLRDREKERNTP